MTDAGSVSILEHLNALANVQAVHARELRELDQRVSEERDRRYAEVSAEREKALKIKEEADRTALDLAREIQKYKDEKANDLRTQIERERGDYATGQDLKAAVEKLEAMILPLAEYVASQQGRSTGLTAGWGYLVAVVGLVTAVTAIIVGL